jgi:Ca-activated chloride channel family protein
MKTYQSYFSDEMLSKILQGKNNKKIVFGLLLVSFIFLVIAIARPIIENKPIKVPQSSISMVVAFDLSKSMTATDVYPTRLEFAKKKFNNLLKNLKDEKVGAIGFSSRSFLVSPITNDYATLKYLVKNLSLGVINVQGSSTYEALQSVKLLLKSSDKKALIIFTDGTDNDTFTKEIKYAKENNIKVFVYAIATLKGGVLKTKTGILKDAKGNIVITKLNDSIKELALQTNGAYLNYSSSSNDIAKFLNVIKDKFEKKDQKDVIINNNEELYYVPLTIALVLFMLAISGFQRRIK